MENSEAAVSCGTCLFANQAGEHFVIVGTVSELKFEPNRSFKTGWIYVYRIRDNALELAHKTEINNIPGAIAQFEGKLLIGIGPNLVLYDFGQKKLIRKCEFKVHFFFIFGHVLT